MYTVLHKSLHNSMYVLRMYILIQICLMNDRVTFANICLWKHNGNMVLSHKLYSSLNFAIVLFWFFWLCPCEYDVNMMLIFLTADSAAS